MCPSKMAWHPCFGIAPIDPDSETLAPPLISVSYICIMTLFSGVRFASLPAAPPHFESHNLSKECQPKSPASP